MNVSTSSLHPASHYAVKRLCRTAANTLAPALTGTYVRVHGKAFVVGCHVDVIHRGPAVA